MTKSFATSIFENVS